MPLLAVSATTRAISLARASAACIDSSSRLLKRDSRWSRSAVRKSSVVTRLSSMVFLSATVSLVLALLSSIIRAASVSILPCWSKCVASSPRSINAFLVVELNVVICSSTSLVVAPVRDDTSFRVETNSATRLTSACSSVDRLACAPVNTSCRRMLPSRSRSNSATVSVRSSFEVSCISLTAAIETWRDCSMALRVDTSMSFIDLLTAPAATSPAVLIMRARSLELPIIAWVKAKPLPSIARTASSVARPMSAIS